FRVQKREARRFFRLSGLREECGVLRRLSRRYAGEGSILDTQAQVARHEAGHARRRARHGRLVDEVVIHVSRRNSRVKLMVRMLPCSISFVNPFREPRLMNLLRIGAVAQGTTRKESAAMRHPSTPTGNNGGRARTRGAIRTHLG